MPARESLINLNTYQHLRISARYGDILHVTSYTSLATILRHNAMRYVLYIDFIMAVNYGRQGAGHVTAKGLSRTRKSALNNGRDCYTSYDQHYLKDFSPLSGMRLPLTVITVRERISLDSKINSIKPQFGDHA